MLQTAAFTVQDSELQGAMNCRTSPLIAYNGGPASTTAAANCGGRRSIPAQHGHPCIVALHFSQRVSKRIHWYNFNDDAVRAKRHVGALHCCPQMKRNERNEARQGDEPRKHENQQRGKLRKRHETEQVGNEWITQTLAHDCWTRQARTADRHTSQVQ